MVGSVKFRDEMEKHQDGLFFPFSTN